MKPFGLFFGTDTGYTEAAADKIMAFFGNELVDLHDIFDAKKEELEHYEFLILGLSTWYDGELQSDWDSFFDEFKEIDFSGKKVALFGLGDQYSYAETFIDGVGILGKVVLENGGELLGKWSTFGYDFDESVAELEDGWFCGLALDEDNQAKQSDERIAQWVAQIKGEFGVAD